MATVTLHTIIQRALRYIAVSKTGFEDLSSDNALDIVSIIQEIVDRDRLIWPYITRETLTYAQLDSINFEVVDNVSVIVSDNVFIPLVNLTTNQFQEMRIVNNYEGLSRYYYFQSPSKIYTYPLGTDYNFEVVGKVNLLEDVDLNTDLTAMPKFILWYLTLSLAETLAPFYEKDWDRKRAVALQKAHDAVMNNRQTNVAVEMPRVTTKVRALRPRWETRTS